MLVVGGVARVHLGCAVSRQEGGQCFVHERCVVQVGPIFREVERRSFIVGQRCGDGDLGLADSRSASG